MVDFSKHLKVNQMNDTTLDAMDALLDGTLDALADFPEFRNYPIGVHRVIINWDLAKTIPGVFKTKDQESSGLKTFIELSMTALETMELPAGSTDTPLEAGAKAQLLFDLTNEFAQGKFKELLKSLAAHYGAKSNRELLADSQGAEVAVVIKHRTSKDKSKTYIDVDTMSVI
jgi:hypothetical protein